MILGLDVSTSITGASIIDKNDELVYCEAWKTHKKSLSFYDKLRLIQQNLIDLQLRYDITSVFIEEPLMGFKSGFSSAQTISKLQRFNGAVCWICYVSLDLKPELISAATARKICGIKVPRGQKAKAVVLKFLLDNEPNFDIMYTVYGNPTKGSYDMADSIVVARAGLRQRIEKETNEEKKTNIH